MAILTISREFGSGGREIGQAVASLLNYEYVDKDKILSDIKAAGIKWEMWGEAFDEHRPTMWEKYDWSFRGFIALMQSCILDHVVRDNVVIMGRGSNFLLRGIRSVLSVRITAPLDVRVTRIMARDSLAAETARWLAERTDNERAGFIRTVYGKKVDDPQEYDMVIDTGRQSENEIVDIIRKALTEKGTLPANDRTLSERAEAARVKAALLTNPKFFLPTLDVYHDGKSIILRGVVHGSKEHKAVEEEAKRIAKESPVKCELHYRG